MKRLPLFFTIAAVAALAASLAYWALQVFKPAQRPIAPVQIAAAPELGVEPAKGLFGGQIVVAAISNYQLRGVVAAGVGRDSAAIIAVDGKPALALAVGREVASGVTVQEIHPKYVMLSEGGVVKRVDLASDGAAPGAPGAPGAINVAPPVPPMPQMAPVSQQPPPGTIGQPQPYTGPINSTMTMGAQPIRTDGVATGVAPAPQGPERR